MAITLSSPPTNAYGLVQYLAQRIPGYDFSEYLRELNSAYIHVWENISNLKNQYFTAQKRVTVVNGQSNFDLLFNSDGGLNTNLSSRLYQITRVRVLPSAGGLFQYTTAMHYNEPDFISISSNPAGAPTQTGPYYYLMTGRGNIQFGLPLAAGTQIEVTYTYWPIALTYLTGGTVSSTSLLVIGTGTNFTQLVQPDFQSSLPFSQFANIPAAVVNFPLQDANGIQWLVGVTNAGQLTTTNNGLGSGQTIILTDSVSNTTSWKLGVTIGGLLTTTTNTFSSANPLFVQLLSANSFSWVMGVTSAGQLTTSTAPGNIQEQIQAELVTPQNQIYRVSSVLNDTNLATQTQVSPALAGSNYVLATLPEVPREHIRVVASLALRNMYSVAGDDERVNEWTAISTANIQGMKDSLIERQSQNPARKQRFKYGVGRRNRTFLN